jgi:hypothetical protein
MPGGMDSKEIRHANLLALIKEHGSAAALARAIETDATYVTNIKNRVNGRAMGDDLARRMEEKLGKPRGWMDVLHAEETAGGAQLLEAYRKASPEWQLTLRLLADLPQDQQPRAASAINDALAGKSNNPDGTSSHQPLFNSRHRNKVRSSDRQKKNR